jgi:hypothetical protein
VLSLKLIDGFTDELIFVYVPPAELARYTLYPTIDVLVLAFQERSTVC